MHSRRNGHRLCHVAACANHALIRATGGVVSFKFWNFCVAIARGGGGKAIAMRMLALPILVPHWSAAFWCLAASSDSVPCAFLTIWVDTRICTIRSLWDRHSTGQLSALIPRGSLHEQGVPAHLGLDKKKGGDGCLPLPALGSPYHASRSPTHAALPRDGGIWAVRRALPAPPPPPGNLTFSCPVRHSRLSDHGYCPNPVQETFDSRVVGELKATFGTGEQ